MPQVFVQGFAEPPKSKAETIMGGLSDVIGVLNERKAKNEAELQEQMRILLQNPQLADTLGEEIKTRWGKKKPEYASLVQAMQDENKLRRDASKSQLSWAEAVAAEEARRYQMQQNLSAMPDTVETMLPGPVMGAPFGMSVPAKMPNQSKKEAADALANLDDSQYVALMKLPPEQRQLVIAMRMRENKSIPQSLKGPLDKNKMDELSRTLIQLGMDPKEVAQIFKVKFGIEVAPAVIAKDAMDDADKLAEIGARETQAKTAHDYALDEIKAREEAARRLESEQHQHMVYRGEAGGWGSGGGEGGGTSKIRGQTNQDAVEEVLKQYTYSAEQEKEDKKKIDMLTRSLEGSPEQSKAVAQQALDDAKAKIAQRKDATTLPPAVRQTLEEEMTGLYNDMAKAGATAIDMGQGRGSLTRDMITQQLISKYLEKINSGVDPATAEMGLKVAINQFRSLYRPQK